MKLSRGCCVVLCMVALVFVSGLGPAATALADGFRNPPEGAAALGRSGVRLTHADDASAVIHNPANLMDLDGAQVTPSITIGHSETTFTPLGGSSETSEEPWRMLPAVYGAWPVHDGRYVLGIGLHVPFGQATEWDKNGVFRYGAAYYAEMRTFDLSPAIAVRIGDKVQVGVGLDLIESDLEFRQQLPFLPPPEGLTGPGTEMTFEGDGYAVGAHVGLTWQVTDRQRVAVMYRSPVSVTYEGDFSMASPIPAGLLPPTVTERSDFETKIDFPSVVGVGYGLQASEDVRVEVNVEWVEHDRYRELALDLDNNDVLLMAVLGDTRIPQNWDDTWTFGVGVDWQMDEYWVARAGWTYLPTPIAGDSVMPSLAENDKNVVAVGLGYERDGHVVDLGYAYSIQGDRTVAAGATPAPGEYEFEQHLLAVSYTHGF